MIGFVTASLDYVRLDFKLGENGWTPTLALSDGLNYEKLYNLYYILLNINFVYHLKINNLRSLTRYSG